MKVINITHGDDMDGTFCGELLKLAYRDCTVIYADYTELLDKLVQLREELDKLSEKPIVYITDLSISGEVLQNEIKMLTKYCHDLVIVDHHKSSESFIDANSETYSTSLCKVTQHGKRVSATGLLFSLLKSRIPNTIDIDSLQAICDAISDWDTWEWKTSKNVYSKQLNTLYAIDQNFTLELLLDICSTQTSRKLDTLLSHDFDKEIANLMSDFKEIIRTTGSVVTLDNLQVTQFKLPKGKSISNYLPVLDTLLDTTIQVAIIIDNTVVRITSNHHDITPVLCEMRIPIRFMRINNVAIDISQLISLQLGGM